MDTKEAASALDGCEYREEGSAILFGAMREAGLVAVFGASDDLMEFRGAIDDEMGSGQTAYLSPKGLIQNECDNDDCPHFERLIADAPNVTANFVADGYTFTYTASFPHETFEVLEDGERYCRGIVFSLDGLAA